MCWFGTHPKYAKLANIFLYVIYQVFTGSTENPHTSILSSKVRQCQHQQLQTDNSMGTLQWANRQQQSSLVMVLARSSHGGSLSTPWCIKNHDKDGKNNVKGNDQLMVIMERHWQHHGTVQQMVTAEAAYGRRGKLQNVRWDWLSTATQHSKQWQRHCKWLGRNCETMSARQLGNTMAQHSDQCNVC